ncbi:MAG: class I SAM-dependent methyltransferase [Candidatus Omnitrophica bacterium]|nr:class I SAM-dependent methyltransferase [Candidatus Omnitrophota bacterium]
MCHESCINFGKRIIKKEYVENKFVLEVGSMDINGSLRSFIESFAPVEYIGVDMQKGPGVDLVCAAEDIVNKFGRNKFDLVICTEVLEHVKNWKKVIWNLKHVVKPGGIVVVTTRSKGFPNHSYPFDFWRYEISDIEHIFADFDIKVLEKDTGAPGVFLLAKKTIFLTNGKAVSIDLYSMLLGKRCSIAAIYFYTFPMQMKVYFRHPLKFFTMIWCSCVKLFVAASRFFK